MSRCLAVIGVCMSLLVVMVGLSVAQDAKPWEQPGTKAGEEIVGPDGGKMVWVPAGEFMMGSPEGEGDPDEHPQHKVKLTKGFWLGKCTVTNAQYQRFCQETGREFPKDSDQGEAHPVVCVNWNDAMAYCDHYGLELPSEAQWEYAARGPQNRAFPWGNRWNPALCCNEGNKGPGGRTFPVGSFPRGNSWCGACDMAGNVWQWCADFYKEDYYKNSPDTDPEGPAASDRNVLRGGSWDFVALYCRSALRNWDAPDDRRYNFGFRCARTP